jgi:chromosome segregation ATPase
MGSEVKRYTYGYDDDGDTWNIEDCEVEQFMGPEEICNKLNDYDALRTELKRVTQQRDEYKNKCKALDTLLAQSQTKRYEAKQQRDDLVKLADDLLQAVLFYGSQCPDWYQSKYGLDKDVADYTERITRIKEQP